MIKFKSINILSNGSLYLSNNNGILSKTILILKKDYKNLELNKKSKVYKQKLIKHLSSYKNKYLI